MQIRPKEEIRTLNRRVGLNQQNVAKLEGQGVSWADKDWKQINPDKKQTYSGRETYKSWLESDYKA